MGLEKTPTALEVAKYLIELAANDPGYRFGGLTNLQLQKLLYYVQGWSLGTRDRPVFRDELRAWKLGPVVKDVYRAYKSYDDKFIPSQDVVADLPPLTAAFVASIWDDYKVYSASELVEKTHGEEPWVEARGGLPDYEPSDILMSDGSMREFFSQPSRSQISADQLRCLAQDSRNVPPQSWYEENSILPE